VQALLIQDVQTRNETAAREKLFQAIMSGGGWSERARIREALIDRIERSAAWHRARHRTGRHQREHARGSRRLKPIAQLKRESKSSLTGNARENRNEIAHHRDEHPQGRKETGKRFQELTFEFPQTQQGFAANLPGTSSRRGHGAGWER
jgi:hypothetical protein